MNFSPFPHRLTAAAWAAEWPPGAHWGEGVALSRELLPPALRWPWQAAREVLAAVDGSGPSVPLDRAHGLLESLENWTVNHRAFLAWPPTPHGFAQAILASVRSQDQGLMAVLAAYPGFCERMMAEARLVDPAVPPLSNVFSREALAQRVAAKKSRTPSTPSAQAPAAATAAPEKTPSEPVVRPSAPAVAPEPPPEFLVKWAQHVKEQPEPAVARQWLDTQVKQALDTHGASAWSWFDRVLYPGLTRLEVKDLEALVDVWPSHTQFAPPHPVNWIDQARFWVLMRDAGPDRREILSTRGLAAMINGSQWNATDRFEMLEKMVAFVSKKQEGFRQRLSLWISMGGSLEGPAFQEGKAYEGGKTVRQWIEGHGNPEWKDVLERMNAPSTESRFRRPGPAV